MWYIGILLLLYQQLQTAYMSVTPREVPWVVCKNCCMMLSIMVVVVMQLQDAALLASLHN
jgi:hypothetical protein